MGGISLINQVKIQKIYLDYLDHFKVKLEPGLQYPSNKKDKKKPHIKKPLNAFMLYMKVRILNVVLCFQTFSLQEMRPKVVAECTLKESAAINQILGRKVSSHIDDHDDH